MRVSPVGWIANSIEEVKKLSKAVSEVTHNHPEGIKGAEAIAMCIFLARQGKTKEELNPKNEEYYKVQTDDRWEEWKNLVNEVADEFDELYKMQVKRFDTFDAAKWQELKAKAFEDLAFIFDDLGW